MTAPTAPPTISYPAIPVTATNGATAASATAPASSSAARATIPHSWASMDVDAAFAGGLVPPKTAVLQRQDGFPIFYAEKLNSIIGESESGKTWVALLAVVQEIRAGNTVAMLDYEDSLMSILVRLVTLGLTREELVKYFIYIHPEEKINELAKDDLQPLFEQCTLVIIDGVTEVMTIEGLKVNDMDGVADFYNLIPKWIAKSGPAVVLIDHVTKSNGDGTFALGSQHKKSGVDGTSLLAKREGDSEFAKGKHGRSSLKIAKDKNGAVREMGVKEYIGTFHLDSHGALADAWIDLPGTKKTILGTYSSTPATLNALTMYVKANAGCTKSAIAGAKDKTGKGIGSRNHNFNDIPVLVENAFLRVEGGKYYWVCDYPIEMPNGIEI